MKIIKRILPLLATGSVLSPAIISADVTFVFDFADVNAHSGIGFDDETTGADRRQALQDVGDYIGSHLDHSATITYTVSASETDGSGFLASAGSSYSVVFETNRILGTTVANSIQTDTSATEGQMTVDFGYNWHTGTSNPSAGQFDFRSVALHEITHSLGFASVIDEVSGNGLNVTADGKYYGDTYSYFDYWLGDQNATPLMNITPIDFNRAQFTDGDDEDNIIDVFTSGNLYFYGPNAVAEYGSPVPLYAPSTYKAGSSTSHFDTTDPTLAGDPMLHAIADADVRRTYSDLDLAVLQDIGYSIITPVPEPSALTLLTTALLFSLGLRRRK